MDLAWVLFGALWKGKWGGPGLYPFEKGARCRSLRKIVRRVAAWVRGAQLLPVFVELLAANEALVPRRL